MDSEDTRGRVQDLEWTGARPTLSAIVCTFDRPESLSRLLDSFATQTGVPVDAYEVIVADNNPAGIAASSVLEHAQRHPQIRYISAPFGGKCAALRVAINAAHGQILHFVDDDHLVRPDYVSAILSVFADTTVSVVTGRTGGVVGFPRVAQKDTPHRVVYRRRRDLSQVGAGANLSVRRAVLERVGNYDLCLGPGTWVGSAEDTDLLYRILKLGYPIHYCPEIRNTHDHRRTDVSQTRNSYFRGKVAFTTKHLMRGDVVPSLLLLKNVLTLTGQAVTRLAHGDFRSAAAIGRRLAGGPPAVLYAVLCTIHPGVWRVRASAKTGRRP